MFGTLTRLRRLFADQFESNGDDYILHRGRMPPLQVSAVDRDRVIEAFNRRVKHLYWGLLAALVLPAIGVTAISFALDMEFGQLWPVGLGILISGAFSLLFLRAWSIPSRELRGAPVAGPAPSKAEARRLAFRQMPWSNLLLTGVVSVILALQGFADPTSRWNWLWFAAGGALLIATVMRAIEKWRSREPT